MLLGGNALIFGTSLKNGRRIFGKLEIFCVYLLLISLGVWILVDQPFINIGIGLFAHFVGGLPTFKHVWVKPQSENKLFWLFFFGASLLSLIVGFGQPLLKQLVPIYFTLFDGSLFALSLRKNFIDNYRASRFASGLGRRWR